MRPTLCLVSVLVVCTAASKDILPHRHHRPYRLGRQANVAASHYGQSAPASGVSANSKLASPSSSAGSTSASAAPSINPYAGSFSLAVTGNSGVSAQQIAVVDDNHVVIYDKVEANPLQVDGHPAYGAVYRLSDGHVRPLHVNTNSFCAGGAFLGNGTMLSVGGNSAQLPNIYHDAEGRQSIRFFTPCPTSESCDVYDNPTSHYLIAQRWYPSVMRFFDGSIFIAGGMSDQGYSNTPAMNQPSYEYFPRRKLGFSQSNGLVYSPFLNATLNANLFPIMFALPDKTIFMAARDQAMIYNPTTNTERRLPPIPNGIKLSYPLAGSGLLLPLNPANNYLPEVMLCGGSSVTDAVGANTNVKLVSSQSPASDQCVRMRLDSAGIAAGWTIERMPYRRTMHSMVMLPDGNILIVNGAQTGVSGYGTVKDATGPNSNADHPAFQPVLYRPSLPLGQRFSTSGIPASKIPRMYHSTATLLPSGQVMISGSAPNLYATYNVTYPTEDRVETLSPPWSLPSAPRPSISSIPTTPIPFGSTFSLGFTVPAALAGQPVSVSLVDPGYSTHGVTMNARLVTLVVARTVASTTGGHTNGTLSFTATVSAPPHTGVWQPGPGWVYVLVGGVPSIGRKVLIGDGSLNQ